MPCRAAASQLRSIILNFDLFGQAPSFRILGKKQFNTILGALLTLMVLLFTLAFLIVGMEDIIDQNSPDVLQSDRQVVQTSPFPLLRNNFTLAITLADLNLQPLPINKYFTFTLKNCKITRVIDNATKIAKVSTNCTKIPLETCTMDHFVTQSQIDYFSLLKVDTFQCIQKDYWDNNPPVLQGIITSPQYQSLMIQASVCQNTTTKTDCAPIEDIKKQLNFGFYGVHLSDQLMQMDNPNEVFSDSINFQYNTFSLSSSKTITQLFRVIDIFTDTGLVFTDYKQQQTLIQDQLRETTELYNNQYLIVHNIYLNSKYSKYTRCYLKVQVVLSRVGGLYQLIFLLLSFLIKGIVQLQLDITMANEIYRFNNEKSTEKSNQRLSLKRINVVDGLTGVVRSRRNLSSPRDSGRLNNSEENESNNLDINQDVADYIKEKDHLGKSFMRILLIFIGCDKKMKKTLEMAKEKYMGQLDIKNIIKKLYELDQLKKVILSEEQQRLFSLLPKPQIVEDLQIENPFNQRLQVSASQLLQEGYDAFSKLLSQGHKSLIDLNIISQLDPDILNIYKSVQRASATDNQLLNVYPLKLSKRRLDQSSVIDSLQEIQLDNDTPRKVYIKTPKMQKGQ